MPGLRHVHTYERVRGNKNKYRCIDAECFHSSMREYLVGKLALCPLCKGEYTLSREHLYYNSHSRPKCLNCSQTKRAKEFQKTKGLVSSLFLPSLISESILSSLSSDLPIEEKIENVEATEEAIKILDVATDHLIEHLLEEENKAEEENGN